MRNSNIDDIIHIICGWTVVIIVLLLVYNGVEHGGNFPVLQNILYYVILGIVCIITFSCSIRLVFLKNEPIRNRIVPAFIIAAFFFGFKYFVIDDIMLIQDQETQMIESTFVDRSNMSYSERTRLVSDLRDHFRAALIGSIQSGDCASLDDFMNHLKVTTLHPDMDYNQKIGAITTNYIFSHCKRRIRR